MKRVPLDKDRADELLRDWGPDPLNDNDSLRFKKVYSSGPKVYRTLAVRGDGKYFITGSEGGLYWLELLDYALQDNTIDLEIEIMTDEDWESLNQ